MINRKELQQAWNRTHQEKPSSQRPEEELVALIERLRHETPEGAPVLDAGCGRGRNSIYLSQSKFTVYGCDISPVAVEIARTRARQAQAPADFLVADLMCLPYLDGLFAAAVCVHVLPYHRLADVAKGVQELRRVLQPNGRLYFDLLDRADAEYRCGRELEPDTFLDPDGVPVHFSTRQEIGELAEGLVLDRVAHLELKSPVGKRVAWAVWAAKPDG